MALPAEQDAWVVAEAVHRAQIDKDGQPYLDHVRRVVERTRTIAPSEIAADAVVAAILHDVVEDGKVTIDDLRDRGFSTEVLDAVDAVSRRPGEPYDDLIARAVADRVGRWVKLADNLDNSDESRLAQLDAPTAARLRSKYERARAPLTADLP